MEKKVEFLGIDIGGAHTKAVGLDIKQKIVFFFYEKCAIWNNEDNLKKTLNKIKKKLNLSIPLCGITITAEMCDVFSDRNEGVKKLSAICDDVGINFFFFCNTRNFFKKKIEAKNVSSMNWLATAKFFEKKLEKCLIIDFGSTTTDLIIIKNHKILNQYFNDFDRINNFELVYTGLTRTPIFSLSNKILLNNKSYNLIPEFFSNMADIYRIKGILPNKVDLFATCDKKDKSKYSSLVRVSRNFGFDYQNKHLKYLQKISDNLVDKQLDLIFFSAKKLLEKNMLKSNMPIVACGIGKSIIKDYGEKLGFKVIDFSNFVCGDTDKKLEASYHVPATSCAFLISELNKS